MMRRYLAQRVASACFVLVGVSFVVFLALHLAPGDPAQILLGPMATPRDLAALREQLGLDRPLMVQYWRWAESVARGDFGRSIMLHRPVLPEVWRRFQATAVLAGAALFLAFPAGVALGGLSAVKRDSRLDGAAQVVAMIGVSMPAFWVGLLLIIGFSVRLGWLPGTGMYAPAGDGGLADLLAHLILPAVTLSLVPLAIVSRITRSNMLEAIAQDYVRTARAKGASEARVIGWHAFRNTLVSLVTVLGLEIGYLLAGAVYVETVFSWPGVGQMMVNAILTRDFPLVQGGVLLVAGIYVTINLATDLLYAVVDPRVRHG